MLFSSKTEEAFQVYTISEYGLIVKYPSSWPTPIEEQSFLGYEIFFPTAGSSHSEAQIAFEIVPISEQLTLDEHVEELSETILNHNSNVQIVGVKDSTLLGANAKQIRYEFGEDKSRRAKIATTAIRREIAYTFYVETSLKDFSDIEAVANDILKSIQFTED